eukprot:TRINITY_DN12509_c0_g1_i1.p1 TRINITY_DN12509_c0_g1~~TRINITY_DN12509_c0_g1_i1.p1  ORF type:complete len:507 (-),score=147.39 TRINITY_DN12509_c0_g1_i1:157-1677(-)
MAPICAAPAAQQGARGRSMLPLTAAAALAGLMLQGCGESSGSTTAPTPAPSPAPPTPPTPPSPPTPGPPGASSYDGNPPFMLQEVGIKGFSYNPLYLNDPSCLEHPGTSKCMKIYNDDVSAEWATKMWSPEGRGDIKTMATFGANAVRLYGNDPRFSKRKFFDELLKNKMKAITGLSNWPFVNQGSPQGCIWKGYDCFANATDTYSMLLDNAEFAKDGYYHNAIEIISIMNEPDIHAWNPGAWKPPYKENYIKALVTAFDGMLSAEKKAGIKPWKNGQLPKITVAWSYAMLPKAEANENGYFPKDAPQEAFGPSIGFMSQFYYAIMDPKGKVGYEPQNDLKQAYQDRFILALQPFNPSAQVLKQAILPARELPGLKGMKLYLGEFNPAVDMCGDKPICDNYGKKQLQQDITTILTDSTWKESVVGMNFFQFQQPYCKDGNHELQYGMFRMRKEQPWRTGYIEGDSAKDHPINCLEWKTKELGEAIAAAYGGSLPELTCPEQAQVVI